MEMVLNESSIEKIKNSLFSLGNLFESITKFARRLDSIETEAAKTTRQNASEVI